MARPSEDALNIIQTVGIVASILLSVYTYHLDSRWDSQKESADLMIRFDQRLNSGKAAAVSLALDMCGSLKCAPGVGDEAIDEFLSDYELIGVACRNGLLEDDVAVDAFGYDLTKALHETRVLDFIAKAKSSDKTAYNDIVNLAHEWGVK